VHGPSVANGYWNNPEATEEGFRATLGDDPTPFMRTGDLGFIDDGQIHITGRAKDAIVVRGRNHYPQDIECTAEQAHHALRPGCGAALPVERDGEERLVLVNEVDRQRLEDADAALVAVTGAILRQHGVQPDAVVLIERGSLPKTSSGKQRRHATRQRLLAGDLPIVAEWRAPRPGVPERTNGDAACASRRSRPEIELWLAHRLAAETGLDAAQIGFETSFAVLGLDSLRAAALTGELADWLGRQVAEGAPWDHPTISRLAHHLAGTQA
jgi:acyl carrier protein